MTSGAHLAIGDLARLTGLSVKTVRFYSDLGLVPPAGRTAAGRRRYDAAAVTRLRLVRTLRALGLDLATVDRVLGGQTSLAEAAAVRVAAVTEQLHALRRTAEQFHADRVAQDAAAGDRTPRPDAVALAIEQAGPALAAGVAPDSPDAAPIVAALTERYAATLGRPAGADVRTRLAARLATAGDPRRRRYLELLSVVNGWPALPAQTGPIAWSQAALAAS